MNNFIDKIKNYKFFDEIYIIILSLIILLSWDYFFTLGTAIVIIIASISIILLNDFKYLIPAGLFFVFSNRDGFKSDSIPIELIVSFSLMIISVITYMILNKSKINLKNNKSILGFGLLAISCFIPIFWANLDKEDSIYYLLYFSYFLYLIIYFIFASNLNKNAFQMLKKSMIYLAIILSFEAMIEIYTLKVNYPNLVLSSITFYSLGWGCCNEAGIIMLMALPFIFMDLINKNRIVDYINFSIKILIVGLGITFTYSRGTYLFGILELIVLAIYSFIKNQNKKAYLVSLVSLGILVLISIQIMFGIDVFLKEIILNGVFKDRLNDGNRSDMWAKAFKIYSNDYVSITFGRGIISDFMIGNVRNGIIRTPIVYHSTLFEVLVMGGNYGLAFLIFHMVLKYRRISLIKNKDIFVYLLISYITVDLYGIIDNTYGMYYFMIPLVIIMATIDCYNEVDLNE